MFVSLTVLVKVLAKGKAVPKAALGTTGRAALVTGVIWGWVLGGTDQWELSCPAPGRGRLSLCLAASADLRLALGRVPACQVPLGI